MATNRFNLVSPLLLFSALLLLLPFGFTGTLALASSPSSVLPPPAAAASASGDDVPPVAEIGMPHPPPPPAFPERWGPPPRAATRDYVPLPGGYGRGSGTLRKWISTKMEEDVAGGMTVDVVVPPPSSLSSATRIAETADDDGEQQQRRQQQQQQQLKWPEKNLVGYTGEDAKFAVLAGDETLREENVHVLPEDSMVTMDYREDRVRIFVDGEGRVVSQPTVG